jgi:hypothetical protein
MGLSSAFLGERAKCPYPLCGQAFTYPLAQRKRGGVNAAVIVGLDPQNPTWQQ